MHSASPATLRLANAVPPVTATIPTSRCRREQPLVHAVGQMWRDEQELLDGRREERRTARRAQSERARKARAARAGVTVH